MVENEREITLQSVSVFVFDTKIIQMCAEELR